MNGSARPGTCLPSKKVAKSRTREMTSTRWVSRSTSAFWRYKVKTGGYEPLNIHSELIPPAIDELVRKCIAEKTLRLKTAVEFRKAFGEALQGHGTLSEVLGAGQLHEVVGTIAQMSPAQFMQLTAGQRMLILQKCNDVVADTDRRLAVARVQFLSVMTPLGIHLPAADYKPIIGPAIGHAFGAQGETARALGHGQPLIRDALNVAATHVESDNHHVLVESLLDWLKNVDLKTQRPGFFHSLRLLTPSLDGQPGVR